MKVEDLLTLVGIITPLVVGFIVKQSYPRWIKGALAILFCLAVALLQTGLKGQLTFQSLGEALGALLIVHQLSYELLTKNFAEVLEDNLGNRD